mgnify:CR=1 FL=1
MTGERDARPGRPEAGPEGAGDRPDRGAAIAEVFLAAVTLGGLAALAGALLYLVKVLGWFG